MRGMLSAEGSVPLEPHPQHLPLSQSVLFLCCCCVYLMCLCVYLMKDMRKRE